MVEVKPVMIMKFGFVALLEGSEHYAFVMIDFFDMHCFNMYSVKLNLVLCHR